MSEVSQQTIPVEEYNLFISYSMDPDYSLSRRIESFLEGFHKLNVPNDIKLKPLQICRDSSDFSLHKIRKESSAKQHGEDYIQQVLIEYLQRSEYLLVLCSPNAVKSKYVNFEVDWFIENKGIDKILVAITQGADLSSNMEYLFPKPIIENNLHARIFYDLRGFKKEAKQWIKVRAFDEELTKLAAHLNDQAPGKILPAWRKEETQKLKRQRYAGGIAALVFLVLAIVAFIERQQAVQSEKEAIANKNEAVSNEKKAIKNLKDYKLEQFQRNMRNGLIYYKAKEDSFARIEFLQATSIVWEFPDDSLLKSQKFTLDEMLEKCGSR